MTRIKLRILFSAMVVGISGFLTGPSIAQDALAATANEASDVRNSVACRFLAPDSGRRFTDPLNMLDREKLADLGYPRRIRRQISEEKADAESDDAQPANRLADKLESRGSDTNVRLTERPRTRQLHETLTVLIDDEVAVPNPSAIAPLPSGAIQRIAFGSCAKHWQHQPIWKSVFAQNPDLFLFLGDAIYSDTDGVTVWNVTEKQLQGEWNRLADKPEYQRFRSQVPIMATWDNHDYGTHNGGAEFELKEISKRIFLDFFGEPKESARRKRAGIYDARIFGAEGNRIQIILLDTRTFRGPFKSDPRDKNERTALGKVGKYIPHADPSVPFLGEAQWQWLEAELRKPAEVRLVCSSTQVIPNTKGMDEWGCYPHARNRLFQLIDQTRANGVILLSGNVHFAEISQAKTPAYPLLEFTSSGMTHIDLKYALADNPARIEGPMTKLNFGLVEIDWSAEPTARVTLKAIGLNGNIEFEHTVSLDQLQ